MAFAICKKLFRFSRPEQVESISELGALAENLTLLIRSKLWVQILLGMFFGIGLGLLLSEDGLAMVSNATAELITGWLVLPGHLFLALIQMIMLPLVLSSIVLGIAGTDDLQMLRRLGLRIAPYFVGTTVAAVLIGVFLATSIEPGRYIDPGLLEGAHRSNNSLISAYQLPEMSIHDRMVGLIPTNPFKAVLDESMLQIVVFAIFIGVALAVMEPLGARPVLELTRSIQELSMTIVSWAMLLAPLAVFGLLAQITRQIGIEALVGLSAYVGTVLLGLGMLMGVYLGIAWSVGGIKPLEYLPKLREVQLLAFSTSSSAAVMPLSIQTAVDKLNISPSTANFIVPVGATINMDGTALYQVVAAIFLTQIYGIDLSNGELLLLIATTVGASIGAPSTPGVGIIILASILTNMGVPANGIALIVGVDRILDMSRTTLNVTGDITACIVMDKWLPRQPLPTTPVDLDHANA